LYLSEFRTGPLTGSKRGPSYGRFRSARARPTAIGSSRGGNRQINAAIHRIAVTRARCHPETRDYLDRKRAEGKTTREAIRCLKRPLDRRIWRLLQPPNPGPGQPHPNQFLDIGAANATLSLRVEIDPGVVVIGGSSAPRPPRFCDKCGTPFPWLDRRGRIYELQNMLDRETLGPADALTVREQLEALLDADLSEQEQRQRWERVRRLAPGLWSSGQNILETVMGAETKYELGL
jgi:hypothetical protein